MEDSEASEQKTDQIIYKFLYHCTSAPAGLERYAVSRAIASFGVPVSSKFKMKREFPSSEAHTSTVALVHVEVRRESSQRTLDASEISLIVAFQRGGPSSNHSGLG